MKNKLSAQRLFKLTLLYISSLLLLTANLAFAGVCDLPGGSGIGGTGMILHGSGIGGTGTPLSNNGNGSGIGGTGAPLSNNGNGSGIGGTGMPLSDNGIGGTGQAVPKTGVVSGTITGFGSICVNGIEIHYAASTPLKSDGQLIEPSRLAIGQYVTASISGTGNEVSAKEIHVIHAARGPVSAVNIQSGEIDVLGQKVMLPDSMNLNAKLPNLQIGDYIEVSGLRRPDGSIMASRIDTAPRRPDVSVLATVSSVSRNSIQIQGLSVTGPVPANLKAGQEVLVSGKLSGNHIVTAHIQPATQLQPAADVGGMVSFETFARGKLDKPEVQLAGRTVVVPEAIRQQMEHVAADQKLILTGRVDDLDRVQIERVHIDNVMLQDDIIHEPPQRTLRHDSDNHEHGERQQHDGGAYEHQHIDHHESEQHHEISVPDHESISEHHDHADHNIPEHEIPEIHEFERHEFEAPEIPEISVPETVEYEAPEVPEITVPETIEYEAPAVPEIEVPDSSEYEHD